MNDQFLKDVRMLSKSKRDKKFARLQLFEYPFDLELLTASPLYRESRKQYLALGGRLSPRVSSTMRSLSAQDLFANEIDYTPAATELAWFAANVADVYDPAEEITALERFNVLSVFHEQNHRILWPLLPPAPRGERALIRYLNFAESLVVMLDLALGDQIGAAKSAAYERMKVLYRTGSKPLDRESYVTLMVATYFILEMMNPEDVLKAVNYVRPETKNRALVARALDLSELFTRITNPQWQERSLAHAAKSLKRIHRGSREDALELPEDLLDLGEEEFAIARFVLDQFGL